METLTEDVAGAPDAGNGKVANATASRYGSVALGLFIANRRGLLIGADAALATPRRGHSGRAGIPTFTGRKLWRLALRHGSGASHQALRRIAACLDAWRNSLRHYGQATKPAAIGKAAARIAQGNRSKTQYFGMLLAEENPFWRPARTGRKQDMSDSLTQLPSPQFLPDRIAQAMILARREGNLAAICHIDLDGFKAVNDQFGTDCGNRLLAVTADRLRQCIRAYDTAVRTGGDTFVLVLGEIESLDMLNGILDRLTGAIAQPVDLGEPTCRTKVSASIGVSIFPHDGDDADALLHRADRAMHLAKNAGGATWRIFDEAQNRYLGSRRRALAELREALSQGQFRLHYQPKVWLRDGRLAGVEALLRWQHPQRGLLSPGEFLPILEGSDLATRVDLWVIETALAQAASWKRQGLVLPVSVNVSDALLKAPNLDRLVADSLRRYPDLEPADLEFEILETVELHDLDLATRNILACARLGIPFAIDDFGTGYSSLTYLKRLPATAIKIDRSFIASMARNPEDLAIVSSILGMASALGRRAIAEGVETPALGRLLGRLGCPIVQGYGICRPLPAEEIAEWTRNFRLGPEWSATGNGL